MTPPKKDLSFLITGAGKGIGRAIALELVARAQASNGSFAPRLFLVSRTQADLDQIKGVASKYGLVVSTLSADLSSKTETERVYLAAKKAFGGAAPDCLINNAGVGRFGDFTELTEEDFDFVANTNLKGSFFLTQKAFSDMRARKSGHVVFVTSVAAETPFEQSAIYCMSKFGQKGLVDVLRLLGRKCGVRVTNVMPGAVETPMWGELADETRSKMMQPEDIARMLVESCLLAERATVEEIVIRPLAGDL